MWPALEYHNITRADSEAVPELVPHTCGHLLAPRGKHLQKSGALKLRKRHTISGSEESL